MFEWITHTAVQNKVKENPEDMHIVDFRLIMAIVSVTHPTNYAHGSRVFLKFIGITLPALVKFYNLSHCQWNNPAKYESHESKTNII